MHSLVCPECFILFQTSHPHKKFCCPEHQLTYSRRNEWNKTKIHSNNRIKKLLAGAKNRSKSKNLEFNLDERYLQGLWDGQEGRCAVTKVLFDLSKPETPSLALWNAPSLDRINPTLGYVKGNVRFVCYQINCSMGQYGEEQLKYLAELIIKGIG